jgi:queuosine precursor transporter
MIWPALYVAAVVLVNWLFSVVPMVITPWGDPWSVAAIVVGLVFIVRDYAQRAIGHWVLLGTAIGIAISYVMADPRVATASAAAFAASELSDWAIYSITKRPFAERVLLSSLVAVPIDTLVFLGGIGGLTATGFVVMCLSKLVALAIIVPRVRATPQTA